MFFVESMLAVYLVCECFVSKHLYLFAQFEVTRSIHAIGQSINGHGLEFTTAHFFTIKNKQTHQKHKKGNKTNKINLLLRIKIILKENSIF